MSGFYVRLYFDVCILTLKFQGSLTVEGLAVFIETLVSATLERKARGHAFGCLRPWAQRPGFGSGLILWTTPH